MALLEALNLPTKGLLSRWSSQLGSYLLAGHRQLCLPPGCELLFYASAEVWQFAWLRGAAPGLFAASRQHLAE